MAEEPDRIRDDIEVTRAELARNVDRLADKTSPTRAAQRGWASTKARVRSVSERVMGTARDTGTSVRDSGGSAVDTVKDKAGSAVDTVKDTAGTAVDSVKGTAGDVAEQVRAAPTAVRRQTQGNPLAAGLIAFGAGLLTASLLPPTEAEKRAARRVREQVGALEGVREPLLEKAQELRQDLGATAKEAASAVKDTATDAVRTTRETAGGAAKDAAARTKDTATA